MPEEVQPTETVTTPEAAPAAQTGETPDALKAELEQARAALKLANREAADRRKKLEAFEAEEAKRKEAEMTEAQKLTKALEEANGKLRAMELNEIRRRVGQKHNLPDALALRLQGATEEEIEADAEALAKILPKPAPKQPGPQPANPGANGSNGETLQQALNRIHGGGAGAFDFTSNS